MAWMLYIDNDGGSELVRSELEQKCYLREPVDIVRCKECKHGIGDENVFVCGLKQLTAGMDWFCADGERKEVK